MDKSNDLAFWNSHCKSGETEPKTGDFGNESIKFWSGEAKALFGMRTYVGPSRWLANISESKQQRCINDICSTLEKVTVEYSWVTLSICRIHY